MRRIAAALATPLLLASLIANAEAPAQADPDALCLQFTVGSSDLLECETAGAQHGVGGATTFEPTMHSDPDGNLFYATTISRNSGVAVGFGAGVHRSLDGGETWQNVTPQIAGQRVPPETNDPYVYVDPLTGRVFSFHMSPILTCSILSFSDDLGASWTTNPLGCGPTGAWDHQTMVAAPPTDTVVTTVYPNVLVQCVNTVYAAECARSLDGGLTWQHTVPAYLNPEIERRQGNAVQPDSSLCGAQHGHLASDLDGNIYLPTSMCGDRPMVYISRDSGLTWTQSVIDEDQIPFTDPTIAVDNAGNVYAAWVDVPGNLWFSVSTDAGETWSDKVMATPGFVTATMPAIIAGDPGTIAIAYPGTKDIPEGFGQSMTNDEKAAIEWGGYFTVSTDALSATPTFQTVVATGADPLMRGESCVTGDRCDYQVDFIEATITPDGQVWASFADGCTNAACINGTAQDNESGSYGKAVAVTLTNLDLCATTCSRFGAVEEAAAPSSGSPMVVSPALAADAVDVIGGPATAAEQASLLARWRELNDDKLPWLSGAGLDG